MERSAGRFSSTERSRPWKHTRTLRQPAGVVGVTGIVTLLESRTGVRDLTLRARDIDLAHWSGGGPGSRLSFTVAGTLAQDSGEAPVGALAATLARSRVAGVELDTGRAVVRFADGQIQAGLAARWPAGLSGDRGRRTGVEASGRAVRVALDFTADTLTSLDSLVTWLVGPDTTEKPRGRALRGAARVELTLGGALDSLTIEAHGAAERVRWRDWEMPGGRATLVYQPGPVPGIRFDGALDSLRHGRLAFAKASAAGAGTLDSLTWFAGSQFGAVGAFATGGRLARRSQGAGRPAAVTLGIDSLSLQLPGGVWKLEQPTQVSVTDAGVVIAPLTVRSASDSGHLVAEGRLPVRGEVRVNVQVDGFPLLGVAALLEGDTAGVGGTIDLTVGIAGTRADPVYVASVAVNNGSLRGFKTPFLDGTLGYREQRLDATLHLWRSNEPALTVNAHLPLDLALVPVAEPAASRHVVSERARGQCGPQCAGGAHPSDKGGWGGVQRRCQGAGDVARPAARGHGAGRAGGGNHTRAERTVREHGRGLRPGRGHDRGASRFRPRAATAAWTCRAPSASPS